MIKKIILCIFLAFPMHASQVPSTSKDALESKQAAQHKAQQTPVDPISASAAAKVAAKKLIAKVAPKKANPYKTIIFPVLVPRG